MEGAAEGRLAKGAGAVVSVAQKCIIRAVIMPSWLARWHPVQAVTETSIGAFYEGITGMSGKMEIVEAAMKLNDSLASSAQ